jgi:hypothetical protein
VSLPGASRPWLVRATLAAGAASARPALATGAASALSGLELFGDLLLGKRPIEDRQAATRRNEQGRRHDTGLRVQLQHLEQVRFGGVVGTDGHDFGGRAVLRVGLDLGYPGRQFGPAARRLNAQQHQLASLRGLEAVGQSGADKGLGDIVLRQLEGEAAGDRTVGATANTKGMGDRLTPN